MNNIFFFQTQQIPESSSILNQLKEQKIFYSYFQVDQNYYLFVYSQTDIQLDTIYQSVKIIQELDSKQRKIRSLRGFFLYALEIMETGKDSEILNTNLQPFFWRKVKNIIRQNQKGALLEFLFGKNEDNKFVNHAFDDFDDKIENLQNQINSLQQKIIQLEENQKLNFKKALRGTLQAPDETKIDQQGDYTLEVKKGPYLSENDPKRSAVLSEVRNPTYQPKGMESKSVSEASRMPVTPLSESQQYDISSNQEKGLHESNFTTLAKISEQERIEIIQKDFQLQAEGKISLKKYYESTDPDSLFQ